MFRAINAVAVEINQQYNLWRGFRFWLYKIRRLDKLFHWSSNPDFKHLIALLQAALQKKNKTDFASVCKRIETLVYKRQLEKYNENP